MTRFLISTCMYLFLELTLLFLEAYEVQSWLGFSFLLVYTYYYMYLQLFLLFLELLWGIIKHF